MSSERAGVHAATTLDDAVIVALRESARVHTAERIPHMAAPLLALADKLEERAGVHTSGTLSREALIERLSEIVRSPDFNAADEADYIIDACVVPDPRLARIEAWARRHLREWPDESEYEAGHASGVEVSAEEVLDIIQGKQ